MDRLTPQDIDATIDAFVRFLILNTDPVSNEAHKVAPCPVVIWEDTTEMEDTGKYKTMPITGKDCMRGTI